MDDSDENQNKMEEENPHNSCFHKLMEDKSLTEPRFITPCTRQIQNYPDNSINNCKYNAFSFLFLGLYEQFQQFSNMYFLILTITQFFDLLKVGYFITYFGPLALVVGLAMLKELIEDIARYYRDTEFNNKQVCYWNPELRTWYMKKCCEVRVGDIIQVRDWVPADAIVINTLTDSDELFIKTDQLDGETDWKQKRCLNSLFRNFQNIESRNKFFFEEEFKNYTFECEKPSRDIYSFSGRLSYKLPSGEERFEGIDIDNCIWANTKVTSGTVQAMVIYTGWQTRMQMNQTPARFKLTRIDKEINNLMKVILLLMCLLAAVMVITKGINSYSLIFFIRYIVMFSYMIPFTTKLNVDMARIVYCNLMGMDRNIPGCVARNYGVPEELSRVDYIFSDKTGTLTTNEMKLKKLYVYNSYEIDVDEEKAGNYINIENYCLQSLNEESNKANEKNLNLYNAITMLATCNNVTPTEIEDNRTLQASSPDEIAFVEFTDSIGYFMKTRNTVDISYLERYNENKKYIYNTLRNIPFKSETKKMRIFFKDPNDPDQVLLFVKGADSEIAKLVSENQRQYLIYKCKELSKSGLRTLSFCYKIITLKKFLEFNRRYEEAYPNAKESIIGELEKGSTLSCVTGVEDRLQNNIADCIDSFKRAGIKIWMLTGDKIETAKCIANSTSLKSRNQVFATFSADYYVKDGSITSSFLNDMAKLELKIDNTVLVYDGEILKHILKWQSYQDIFLKLASRSPSVLICRCSPTQKAEVVKLMQNATDSITLSIGDGGNDVAMITTAHVGIGIFGKEGQQAALSSDISIEEFQHLKPLMFWHGRNSYMRTAALAQFIIHRGFLITVVQMCFSLAFYNSPVNLYNSYLLIGWGTVFTSFPIFAVILDHDTSEDYALNYPILYKNLKSSRDLSFKSFIGWTLISFYQGSTIILLSIYLFVDSYLYLTSISFTAIVLCEYLNVRSTVRKWHYWMTICIFVSILIYILTLIVLDGLFDVEFLFNIVSLQNIGMMLLVAWAPIFLLQALNSCLYPSEIDKLARAEQEKEYTLQERFSLNTDMDDKDKWQFDNDNSNSDNRDKDIFNLERNSKNLKNNSLKDF